MAMTTLYPVSEPKNIQINAWSDGDTQAKQLYPHVMRERSAVEQLARDIIKGKAGQYRNRSELQLTDDMEVYTRLYTQVFVSRFLDKVASLDRENSTSTAKLSVREEEHTKMGTHSYIVTLTDMRYLKKPVEFIVSVADEDVKLKES